MLPGTTSIADCQEVHDSGRDRQPDVGGHTETARLPTISTLRMVLELCHFGALFSIET